MPPHGSYGISAFANAAEIPIRTLNRHLDRKIIKMPGHNPKSGKGHPREFSLSSVYVTAIGHTLTRLKVTPTEAMKFASAFLKSQRGRNAGQLFASGKTLLLVKTDGTASIVNLDADQDVLSHLEAATIVLDLGKLISTVNSRISN
jgi:hypothetical protein